MAITVPAAGQVVDANTFGAPVANALNRGAGVNAITRQISPDANVANGAQTAIQTVTFTVPASIGGIFVTWALSTRTAIGADFLVAGPTAAGGTFTFNSWISPTPGMCSGSGVFVKPPAATSITITMSIYAWAGGPISTDATKSYFTAMSLGFASVGTTAFPT